VVGSVAEGVDVRIRGPPGKVVVNLTYIHSSPGVRSNWNPSRIREMNVSHRPGGKRVAGNQIYADEEWGIAAAVEVGIECGVVGEGEGVVQSR